MSPLLTIIIPAKHEEDSILAVLESLRNTVKTPHRIIVVNDTDSDDKTARIVRRYMKHHANASLIHRTGSRNSFASALTLGIAAAKTLFVVPVMADLCDNPQDIDRMVTKMNQGWDIVCASRYMKGGSKSGGPLLQSFFSRFVCTSLHLLTGVPTRDISNAYKMYRTSLVRGLPLDETGGVEVSMELVLQAYFQGARITEIPTRWTGRTTGVSKFKFWDRLPRYLRIYLWAIAHRLAQSRSSQPATGA